MSSSTQRLLEQKKQRPYLPPKTFGIFPKWLDDTLVSMLAALLILGVVMIGALIGPWMSEGSTQTGEPKVEVTAVQVLGDSPQTVDSPHDEDVVIRTNESSFSDTPVEAAQQLTNAQPRGSLPDTPTAPIQPATNPSEIAKRQSDLARIKKLLAEAPRLGGSQLTGIFEIDPNYKTVVFIIDKSGSMGADLRLERVKAELIYGINALKTDQKFAVVFFDEAAHLQGSSLQLRSATDGTKKNVIDWIQQMPSGGGTDPLEAASMALQKSPELIVLLSDGEFAPSIVGLIHAKNQSETRINTIGLGEYVITLKQLAEHNSPPGNYFQAR
ncbi:MAG: VWA domain-containing protein [Planctomycetaceae bacterium]|nr:VWA domain-containing protein [Planctomycetaceae bacterium]